VNSPEVIDARRMNRAVLARQLLIDRAAASTPEILEKMAGLQAQYAPSSYVGLWSRRLGMERSDLDAALEDRSVIQGTLMRVTIHLASRGDYWPFAAGLRSARRQMWLRLMKGGRTDDQMTALADRTRTILSSGPMKRAELIKQLGVDSETWVGIGLWLDLVRVPPSGTWARRRADLYGLAEEWVGPDTVDEEQGVDHLIRRYLEGFGTPPAKSSSTCRTGCSPTPRHRCRFASSRPGTPLCWSTAAGRGSCPSSSGPACSTSRTPSR
jgi:hypothetical protein